HDRDRLDDDPLARRPDDLRARLALRLRRRDDRRRDRWHLLLDLRHRPDRAVGRRPPPEARGGAEGGSGEGRPRLIREQNLRSSKGLAQGGPFLHSPAGERRLWCAAVRWQILPHEEAAEPLARALGCHPLVAQILWRRGLRDPEVAAAFLDSRLRDLPDPASLAGIEPAVRRLAHALVEDEPITAFGDYDVDGVSSTALLVSFLRACGARRVDYVLPHRLRDGYGLGAEAVRRLAERGTRLLGT